MIKIRDIKIDRGLCIGVGTCVVLAPNTFELDDELIAVLKNQKKVSRRRSPDLIGEGDSDGDILTAAKSCPVLAIILEDENGKQIYP